MNDSQPEAPTPKKVLFQDQATGCWVEEGNEDCVIWSSHEAQRLNAFHEARASAAIECNHQLNKQFLGKSIECDSLRSDLSAALNQLRRAREEAETMRKALEDLATRLDEIPRMVLANEKLNPAWSKAELWGIERDIIPSIRMLCMSAEHIARSALTTSAPKGERG